jgi:NAD(P)-dependent dehydrogenase (short-subunit alcohol dehydrogenase family)
VFSAAHASSAVRFLTALASLTGGRPNIRPYSRVNCGTLSYPTANAALLADAPSDIIRRRASISRKGVFFLTQTLLPLINDGGRIVNTSTAMTRFAYPGYAAYAAAKGAVEVLTVYLAKELGARGITVNTVAPGAIETDFGGGAVRDNPETNQKLAGMTALGRVGVPEDIGPMVASLLSPDNRWVNAQRIEVSGGQAI